MVKGDKGLCMEGITTTEMWTGLVVGVGSQLLVLAYGVGQFKAKFATMEEKVATVTEELGKLKKLVAMVWFGPEVDAEVLTSDMNVMRQAVAHRRAYPSADRAD